MKPSLLLLLRSQLRLALIVVISLASLYSCVDDKFNIDKISTRYRIDPTLFLTIGSSEFTIDSILNHLDSNQYIHTTDSGLIYILYEKDLEFYKGEDKFIIPAHDSWSVDLPSVSPAIFPPTGNFTLTIDTFKIPVSFSPDQIIDSIDIKQLQLGTTVTSSYNHPSVLTYTFTTLVKNKIPFVQTYRITGTGFSETQNTNVGGYFLKFTNASPGMSYIPVKISLVMTGTPGTAVGAGTMNLGITTDNLKYNALYGYAGQKELLNIKDSMNLGFLNNYITNKIEWKNPQITISANNSYIILPIRLTIDTVSVYSKLDNRTYNVGVNPNTKDLLYPDHIGDAMRDTVKFTKIDNPDLYHAVESVPEYLKFHIKALANPDKITSKENIIIDTSSIKLHVNFNLPLWFRSGGFGTTDTLDFNFQDIAGDNLDSIQFMLFRLIAENGMPVDMKMQVYFTDTAYNVLDSMYHTKNNLILIGGALGTDDRVVTPTRKVSDATFDTRQLKALKNTKKLLVKIFLNTSDWNKVNGRYVKFYSDYKFKLSFVVRFQGKFTGYF